MSARPITTVRTIVTDIAEAGTGIKLFSLADPDHWELPPFKPGAHIDLHLPNGLVRTYSLCNEPADNTRYVIAVKREADGRGGSRALHDDVGVGDVIGVSLPRGGLEPDARIARYVFVAGGIGVTPFLSATRHLQRTAQAEFTLHLVVREEVPLAAQLGSLIEMGIVVVHRTSREGRPDLAELVGDPGPETLVACCGPESMTEDFERLTAAWPKANVHIERFVAPPPIIDPDAKPFTLSLARSGTEIQVRAGQTMLAALQEGGIDVATSCCGGICGACKVGWIEGRPVHRDRILTPYERERYLMVCVAGSDADRLVLDL
ncbi:oxidoreductase [Bradyrhizobium sacchari]|uniref:Vanillate O-demethylase ferredoxin subunit n=1 Tax=Bradyrhizobium sacchari TaxID=1399419 RepID=A0A560K9F8_9BRAD|nr:PDR/VanB family oxidoreductase [Bradyrhizobium sacchari]OPY99971.1 oxidoreductase [Bradyrhizobium sacchari]TWB54036.1 vanillate O-demethylase ferredoxin subunit [Bradyrhizobium sacchari]TWB78484.1 vanillate O-demethylase ferredoxin subunit [Bradyrhizobium sacchari]